VVAAAGYSDFASNLDNLEYYLINLQTLEVYEVNSANAGLVYY
jgi:hypothetical protein